MSDPGGARPAGGGLDLTSDLLGFDLWPWQRQVAEVGLAREGGHWRFPIMVVAVPRQSGKTRLATAVCVDRCLSRAGAQVWYTAQSRMDAVYRWREMVGLLRRSPLSEGSSRSTAAGWDYRVRSAVGAETVEFANGSQLRVFTPAEDSLHGSATDLVVLDEARFFDAPKGDALLAAVLPTQATTDGQVWIMSTAGGPDSLFLRRQLDAARLAVADPASLVALAEWGIDPDTALDGTLVDEVWAAHPSAGLAGGPARRALDVAATQMPPWQFAHEYGNRWATDADLAAARVRVLSFDRWEACRHVGPLAAGRPTFAVDIPPDRSAATVVACVDGVVEVADVVPALDVVRRLLELAEKWDPYAVAVDAAGPAGTVANDLRTVFDRLVVSSTRDLTAACAAFYDAVLAGTARIRPSTVFDDAAETAERRTIGQAWTWDRTTGGSPLIAASLALWAECRAVASTQDWTAF